MTLPRWRKRRRNPLFNQQFFVPTLGAWVKPLLFKPPATPTAPSTPTEYDLAKVGNQLAALWPTLMM